MGPRENGPSVAGFRLEDEARLASQMDHQEQWQNCGTELG